MLRIFRFLGQTNNVFLTKMDVLLPEANRNCSLAELLPKEDYCTGLMTFKRLPHARQPFMNA